MANAHDQSMGQSGSTATNSGTGTSANDLPGAHFRAIANGFLALLEIERPPLVAHCKRVARWARELGVLSGFLDHELLELETAALLHDIGFISSSISLLSPSLNDRSQDERVKRHPMIGFSVLSQLPGFEKISLAVLHHHEKIDGTGYPQKLKGEAIPQYSKMIAVADMFDLETHPGTGAMVDIEQARKKILLARNHGLDGDMVNRFLFIVTTSEDLHQQDTRITELPLSALRAGMMLARDLKTIDGTTLLRSGIQLTDAILNKAFSSGSVEWLLTTAYVDPNSIKELREFK